MPTLQERLRRVTLRRVAIAAAVASVVTAAWLALRYREMGGPGDELVYFKQSAQLIPFVHNYYGPGYFVALRLVHMALPLDWFSVGKFVAVISLAAYLLACYALFGRVLGAQGRWLALLILALNPQVLYGGYEVTNNMYAAAFLIAAIWLTARTDLESNRGWIIAGLLFGLAYLTRFASLGYFLGALAGVWLLRAQVKDKARVSALMAVAAGVPVLAWTLFLLAVQGFVPTNYNFVHLTYALGKFPPFADLDAVARQYGSMSNLLRSDPTVPLRLAVFGVKEFLEFPFTMGFQIYFVLAGLLIPGFLIVVAKREMYAPWLVSLVAGLFLTGLAAHGWGHYYLPVVPLGVFLIVVALERLSQAWGSSARWLIGLSLAVLMTGWTVADSASRFAERNWVEFGVARRYLERHSVPGKDVVSSTAASLIYGSNLPFVDQSRITTPHDSVSLVDRLRQHDVNYLVISERHTLFEFPELRPLLADVPRNVPDGLQRDTLITTPRRLAIYSVLPAPGAKGQP